MLFFGRDNASGRDYLGLDVETECNIDVTPVPRLVCLQYYDPQEGVPRVVSRHHAARTFKRLARLAIERDTPIVGHNVAFDMAALCRHDSELWPLVWRLYDLGLIEDTIVGEKLDAIARGQVDPENGFTRFVDVNGRRTKVGYGLADCVHYRSGGAVTVAKGEETWRKRYGELRDVPVEEWPADALEYARNDPFYAYMLRRAQDAIDAATPVVPGLYTFADVPAQTRAAWALFLCRWAGVQTDPRVVPVVKSELEARTQRHEASLVISGILRAGYRTKGTARHPSHYEPPTRDMDVIRRRVEAAYASMGVDVPLTKGGKAGTRRQTSTEAATLLGAGGADPLLKALNEYMSASKLLQFVASLEQGYGRPIHTEPNVLVATGRTSWGSTSPDGDVDDAKKINLQNLPKVKGMRESYIPPPGMVMFAIDYKQLELCTLGYVCKVLFGYSRMLDLINEGIDLHSTLAAQFLGISYEEFERIRAEGGYVDINGVKVSVQGMRQLAKAFNFGAPGGMGVDRFIVTAYKEDKNKDIRHLFTRETVQRLKDAWFAAFPELKEYRKFINSVVGNGWLLQLTSGRIRGNIDFCSASNSFFQGLAADGAKEGLYTVQRAMWSDPSHPAYGGHVFAFVHDEIVGCVPADRAAEAVAACYDMMMNAMRVRLPGVHIEGSQCLMFRWTKAAEDTRDAAGKLIPFEQGAVFAKLSAQGKVFVVPSPSPC